MSNLSIFDIVGPIMIGPSSSHTAGAVKIGLIANKLIGEKINKVTFKLHGSFASTYKGHGTDKALIGGLLGFNADDIRIRNSFQLAHEQMIEFDFKPADLGDVHPNTVRLEIETVNSFFTLTGSSVGGGRIIIKEINGLEVNFRGDVPTLVIPHKDIKGIIARVSHILASKGLNIASMSVFRKEKGATAIMIVELDTPIDIETREKIKNNSDYIHNVYQI